MRTVYVRIELNTEEWEKRTIDGELGALVEKTETLGTVLASEKVLEGTSKRAGLNLNLVAGEGGVVAASNLVVVTTGSLGLLDGHVVANRPERLLSANLGTLARRSRANVGESDCGSSESKKSGGELHFDCCLKRTNVLQKVGKSKRVFVWKTARQRSEYLRECVMMRRKVVLGS